MRNAFEHKLVRTSLSNARLWHPSTPAQLEVEGRFILTDAHYPNLLLGSNSFLLGCGTHSLAHVL